MKPTAPSKPEQSDATHHAHASAACSQPAINPVENLTLQDSAPMEIFYDGREVYGGY